MIGADAEGTAPLLMRAMGLREVTQGLGILARPRPTGWAISRKIPLAGAPKGYELFKHKQDDCLKVVLKP